MWRAEGTNGRKEGTGRKEGRESEWRESGGKVVVGKNSFEDLSGTTWILHKYGHTTGTLLDMGTLLEAIKK